MKIHLVETYTPSIEERALITKVPLNEVQRKFVEGALKQISPFPEGKAVYKIPISKYNILNGNKRMYPKALWENVIKNQAGRYISSLGLCDHPPENSDGSAKDVFCVYHGLELSEKDNLVFAYMTPVGKYGELFTEVLESNGRAGLSTSGFGEIDEVDGQTVNPTTFELERIADCVLTPSQGVYGTKDMIIKTANGTTVIIPSGEENQSPCDNTIPGEPVQTTPELVQTPGDRTVSFSDITTPLQVSTSKIPAPPLGGITNLSTENLNNRSKTVPNNTMSKLEERKLEKDLTVFFNEAKLEKNPITKSGQLKEILGFFNDIPVITESLKNLKDTIEKEFEAVTGDVHTKVAESLKIEEEIGVKTVDEMKSGLDKLAESAFSFNESADHWKQVAETLQKNVEDLKAKLSANPTAEEYEEIVKELEKTDIATRKIVDTQNSKILSFKKRLFEERNLSRKIEAECSEVKAQLEAALSAKKNYREKAVQFRDAYVKIIEKNKMLVSENKKMIEDVTSFLEGDMYRFGRDQKIAGSKADNIGKTTDFTQKQYVLQYYEDLEKQYGEDVVPYKEQIISRKTYKEAQAEWQRIFSRLDEFRIPKGIEGDERREYLKENGINIKDRHRDTKSAIRQILDGYRKVGE